MKSYYAKMEKKLIINLHCDMFYFPNWSTLMRKKTALYSICVSGIRPVCNGSLHNFRWGTYISFPICALIFLCFFYISHLSAVVLDNQTQSHVPTQCLSFSAQHVCLFSVLIKIFGGKSVFCWGFFAIWLMVLCLNRHMLWDVLGA